MGERGFGGGSTGPVPVEGVFTKDPKKRWLSVGLSAASLETSGGFHGQKLEIFKDKVGQFRFRLKVGNGEVIATREGYTTKASCHARSVKIDDHTQTTWLSDRKVTVSRRPWRAQVRRPASRRGSRPWRRWMGRREPAEKRGTSVEPTLAPCCRRGGSSVRDGGARERDSRIARDSCVAERLAEARVAPAGDTRGWRQGRVLRRARVGRELERSVSG